MKLSTELPVLQLDTAALNCPMLFVTFRLWLKKLQPKQQLRVTLVDHQARTDIVNYLIKHQFSYRQQTLDCGVFELLISGKQGDSYVTVIV